MFVSENLDQFKRGQPSKKILDIGMTPERIGQYVNQRMKDFLGSNNMSSQELIMYTNPKTYYWGAMGYVKLLDETICGIEVQQYIKNIKPKFVGILYTWKPPGVHGKSTKIISSTDLEKVLDTMFQMAKDMTKIKIQEYEAKIDFYNNEMLKKFETA